MQHLGVDKTKAKLAIRIVDRVLNAEPSSMPDTHNDLILLEKMDANLSRLMALYNRLQPATRSLLAEPIVDETYPNELNFMSEDEYELAFGFIDIVNNFKTVRQSVLRTREAVEKSPTGRASVSRINTRGMDAAAAAIKVWRRAGKTWKKGRTPPQTLNPASEFGSFFADLLAAWEIKANPKSAYEAATKLRRLRGEN
jgi:hypothetical protein